MNYFNDKANIIWFVADLLRGPSLSLQGCHALNVCAETFRLHTLTSLL